MRRGPKLTAVQRQPLLTGYLKQGFHAARALGGSPCRCAKAASGGSCGTVIDSRQSRTGGLCRQANDVMIESRNTKSDSTSMEAMQRGTGQTKQAAGSDEGS
jgi:hypothetical protein